MDKSLSDTDINQMGRNCKNKNKPSASSPNYVFQRVKRRTEDMDEELAKQLQEFKEEMRKMMTHFTERYGAETQQINSTLKEIQKSNIFIETSITALTTQNEELRTKIDQLEMQAKEEKNYITVLENKIEDIQMGGRKSNFVIKNVPKKEKETKEDLIDMVMCLASNLDCKINKYDVKDIYRVRGKNTEKQNTPIIVETSSTLLRTAIMKMGKAYNIKNQCKLCCKHLGFKIQEDTPIFLSEHLTPKGSRLHFLARDLTKSGAYKFCWTAYGKVYIKKHETSPTITIRSEQQVHQLLLKE